MGKDRIARRATVGFAVSALALVPIGAAVASAGESEPGPAQCGIEALALPNDITGARITGADSTGTHLVGDPGDGGPPVGLLWMDGAVEAVSGPNAADNASVHDINGSGVAIGSSEDDDGNTSAWTFDHHAGEYAALAAPDNAQHVVPQAINDAGDIVGYSQDAAGELTALVWSTSQPDAFDELAQSQRPDDPAVVATDISENGVIVGGRQFGGTGAGTVWADAGSEPTRLVAPSGSDVTTVNDVSSDGVWAAGSDNGNEPGSTGVLWDLDGDSSAEKDAASLGSVNSQGDSAEGKTIVRADDSTIELPALNDAGQAEVVELFDRGGDVTAAGTARGDEGDLPVVWQGC